MNIEVTIQGKKYIRMAGTCSSNEERDKLLAIGKALSCIAQDVELIQSPGIFRDGLAKIYFLVPEDNVVKFSEKLLND